MSEHQRCPLRVAECACQSVSPFCKRWCHCSWKSTLRHLQSRQSRHGWPIDRPLPLRNRRFAPKRTHAPLTTSQVGSAGCKWDGRAELFAAVYRRRGVLLRSHRAGGTGGHSLAVRAGACHATPRHATPCAKGATNPTALRAVIRIISNPTCIPLATITSNPTCIPLATIISNPTYYDDQ